MAPTDVIVTLNEAALRHLLDSEGGPTGQYIAKKGYQVVQAALPLAGGSGPGGRPRMRSGDLLRNLRSHGFRREPDGLSYVIGTDARHGGDPYPRRLESGGVSRSGKPYRYPFLEPALAEVFPTRIPKGSIG